MWRAMATLIDKTIKEAEDGVEVGLKFNNCPDISKAIAAWGYRYLLLAQEYQEQEGLDEILPPSFYSPLAEQRIRDEWADDESS